ncbi:PepSY-associated TM helix domain-containing protein [Zunongwangia sp. HRR-M8]|uniref:PepSY-associated TM helix domain-containing protein n=1 Tax=Zunongwangia sp. HRR-M8 TaxID=3015170 RepID=UPI0022DD0404|nr:PepSY-associated TM helix domain-containing protein [Zunongwangia sp. HRR-M8]WBL20882.1 PepSY-associated TM helix domain-containing protein [Zunongwangia sp. HRR-M8]
MAKRNYNVFFHLHTISGIIISAALFIIFFCGAFALIKDEITAWEKGENVDMEIASNIDYDRAMQTLENEGLHLTGRDIRMIPPDVKQKMFVGITGSKAKNASDEDKIATYYNLHTRKYRLSTYYEFYSIGELIYRLHFFHQVPIYGIYIAGLIAFFFLLAIISGIIVHWKKIVSNFYIFRPTTKLKTIWTDAHTALGVIGLPFQFMFAITSCFLCLSALVLLPINYVYNGDQDAALAELRPMQKTYEWKAEDTKEIPSLNDFVEKTNEKWPDFEPSQVYIKNYGGTNMKFQIDGLLNSKKAFLGHGRIVYDVMTNTITEEKNPEDPGYAEVVEVAIRKLHFGDFGGLSLKIIYFVLAIITCFVILSGVLIWLEARDKKHISEKKRKFNRGLGYFYISICMSLYPITAFSMLVAKYLPRSLDTNRQSILYAVFFIGWLIFTLFFSLRKNNYLTTKHTLLLGSIFGIFVPIINGITSGNWLWMMYQENQTAILFVDIFWIAISLISFGILIRMKKPV